MNTKIHALIGAGIDCYMDMRNAVVAENDHIARGELFSVYIGRVRTDLFKLSGGHQDIQRRLPGGNRLKIPAGRMDGIQNKLRVGPFDVGQVVAEIIGDEGRTAKSALFKLGNVGGFPGCSRTVRHGFFAGAACAVTDF